MPIATSEDFISRTTNSPSSHHKKESINYSLSQMRKISKSNPSSRHMESHPSSPIFSRLPLLLLTLFLMSQFENCSGVRINSNGGYEDITVAISSEVPPIACQQLLQNIQGIFSSASAYLYEASNQRVYFRRVEIVLPPNWNGADCSRALIGKSVLNTSASSVANAEFRIGPKDPVYGFSPHTQQSQGCGKGGDYIGIGYQYIMQFNNDSRNGLPMPERGVVHEWAKFRYGVFEEKGYENDPIYPMSYYESRDEGRKLSSCTNKPLKGKWSEQCSNDALGGNCIFSPSENENVTSSIMSFPHLRTVKKFCDSKTHNPLAPTKQNFLCDKKSVKEVIFSHPDFRTDSSSTPRSIEFIETEFILKQLTQPRFVLLVEETGHMNLRDVWKYLKLAIRKFIKYELPEGTSIGLVTVGTEVRTLANMTILLDGSGRGTLAEKLPNYPNIETNKGGLSLLKGITHAINMLKSGGARASGSTIILISQGTISSHDKDNSIELLRREDVSIATVEYPSVGDGRIGSLAAGTKSPSYSIRETGVGSMSHMSTYIQLVNALMDIQRFYTRGISSRWPTLVHQEEFKGDSPRYVESSFRFDSSLSPAEFYIYIPSPIDPKVNTVELTSPTGRKFTDQLSYLHDINVIKIDAEIDEPGIWRYRIERLGDSHQSHFVQVMSSGGSKAEDITVRVFSNVEESRVVDLSSSPLLLYAEVRRGNSPVIGADVVALIDGNWSLSLLDSGNGDPDLMRGDGIYSRYIVPPDSFHSRTLQISVKVTTSPHDSRVISLDSPSRSQRAISSHYKNSFECCGSDTLAHLDPSSLKPIGYNERIVASYNIKVLGARARGFYNPSRVGDLRVLSTFDKDVLLQFTAPGDDYDSGSPAKFELFYSTTRKMSKVSSEVFVSNKSQAGTVMNITIQLPAYNWYFIHLAAVDRFNNSGKMSNLVQVQLLAPPAGVNEIYNSYLASGSGGSSKAGGSDKGLSGASIGLIIGGVVVFLALLALLFILCYCRRKGGKTMGSTETKISTISSDAKAPIHWSASELLQEHEKRQSIYAQTQSNYYDSNGGGGHTITYHTTNGSPGSSTRSFRSISETNRKTSLDSMSGGGGRRGGGNLTDYESCSSDKTLKSAKGGPLTDYDTCVESDVDNYKTLDHYPSSQYQLRGTVSSNYAHPHYRIPNNNSHLQYNPTLQGSLTSVNSKKRNITMV